MRGSEDHAITLQDLSSILVLKLIKKVFSNTGQTKHTSHFLHQLLFSILKL